MAKDERYLLQVKDLEVHFFTYGGVVEALDGVSFTIRHGETFGLVGESGCGKSVTALSILRLIPRPGEIVGGTIEFEGENLLAVDERRIREIRGGQIAIIFQDPTAYLNPLLRVGFQMAEPLIYHQGVHRSSALAAAVRMIEKTKMPDPRQRARNYPHEFSGGLRQRAMVGMAMMCDPKLLIADEPTTNLDVTIQRQILDLIKKMQLEHGTSVLLITHDLGVVAEMCDRVAVMYAGHIVEVADVFTIFKNSLHPYTNALKESIPTMASGRRLAEIPGFVPQLINPPTGCRFHPRCTQAMPVCSREKPRLIEIEAGHMVACHLYGGRR